MAAPPPYAAHNAPPPPTAYPHVQGYPPGYGAQTPYPAGYAPPPQPHMMYSYPPPAAPMQQTSNNVTVVNTGGPVAQTVFVEERGVNHLLHFCISLFFWPWVFVWIILCITE